MLRKKQLAYRAVFSAPNGEGRTDAQEFVLADLAKFCRANQPATRRDAVGRMDPLATAVQIGRQEMFQRIQAMLNLPLHEVTMLGHLDLTPASDDDGITL